MIALLDQEDGLFASIVLLALEECRPRLTMDTGANTNAVCHRLPSVPDGSAIPLNFIHRPLPRPIESSVDYAKLQAVLVNDHYRDRAPKMRRTSRWQRTKDPGPAVGLVGGLDISVTR